MLAKISRYTVVQKWLFQNYNYIFGDISWNNVYLAIMCGENVSRDTRGFEVMNYAKVYRHTLLHIMSDYCTHVH